jgi:AcrR family transcriptional regulator
MDEIEPQVRRASGPEMRERRRRRQAAEIELIALRLFAARGFEAVTVDEIAASADISKRTFFRYFATKDEILLGDRRKVEDCLADALQNAPTDRTGIEVMRETLIALSRECEADAEGTALRQILFKESHTAMAAAHEQQRLFHHRLAPLMARRMATDSTKDFRPALIINVLVSATYVAQWHALVLGGDEPPHRLVAKAIDHAIAGLGNAVVGDSVRFSSLASSP